MKAENLVKAIGEIDEELIFNAFNDKPKKKKFSFESFITVAACLCLVAIIWAVFPQSATPEEPGENNTADGENCTPASLKYNGRKYIISSYLSIENELPIGFTEAGMCSIGGEREYPFFVNPDTPEYVYVYHTVYTNGEVDSSNTLINTPPHKAYVLYVDERLRGDDLIAYNGDMYISLWSADYYGNTADVTEEYYNYYYEKYTLRIEGDAPEGFKSAGITVFTGHDTVPKKWLASNIGKAEVYYNLDEPNVLLFATTWHTVKGIHYGYDVYIKYDCPFAD